jgi:hypothetical protein
VLVASEIFLFVFEENLSLDVLHINSFIENKNSTYDAIILGNSLTREGIDTLLLSTNLTSKIGNDRKIAYVYPDDTSIIEWFYFIKYQLLSNQDLPKRIFINFASNQLVSERCEFEEIQRISTYAPFSELRSITLDEEFTLSESLDLFLSKLFRTYLHRERIAKRTLDVFPHYRSTIRKMNDSDYKLSVETKKHYSYKHLSKVIELADKSGVELIFCAFPLPYEYPIVEDVKSIISNSNLCRIVNLQDSGMFTNHDFSDGYHLNKVGAKKLTMKLINVITQ